MSNDLRISVVVVSSGRPNALRRCLKGLAQLRYNMVEIIVVADVAGLAAAQSEPWSDRLCLLPQDTANISVARNLGIAAAAGDVVAFIDDDAVPEPTWTCRIAEAFQNDRIDAVTGVVLGRNGISVQWGRMAVDHEARDRRLKADEAIGDGEALKLHGTNMAIRRHALEAVDGFNPAFAFFLDDTDLALRLAITGHRTAFLGTAIVHHGFAASQRRTADRVPLSLFDIGASTRVFLKKHAPHSDHSAIFRDLEDDQRARLLCLARKRKLDTRDMRQLMESLHAGWTDGANRDCQQTVIASSDRDFSPFRSEALPDMQVLAGRMWQAAALRKRAANLVTDGIPVTLFLFEPTPRKHKAEFTSEGWWEQVGGLYGPAIRSEKRFQVWCFKERLTKECDRIASERGLFK